MKPSSTLRRLFARARNREVLTYLVAPASLVLAVAIAGNDITRHVHTVEAVIGRLGPPGVFAFIAFFVVATSLLLPETLLSIMAGALFGLPLGLTAVFIGSFLAAALQYGLAHRLLRALVENALGKRPSLGAIQRAVLRDELKLQALLRLTPLNPATISYMLGAAGVGFGGFMLACVALTPLLVIEVYLGYAGKHVAIKAGQGSTALVLHDLVVFGGLAVTVIVVFLVSRLAHKAVMEAVTAASTAPATP